MTRSAFGRTWFALLVLLGLVLSGCQSVSQRLPFIGGGAADADPRYEAPHLRLARLNKLAKELPSQPTAVRQSQAVKLLQQYHSETDPMIQASLVRAITACGTAESDQVLRSASIHPTSRDIRIAACEGWAKRGTPEAVDQLVRLMEGASTDSLPDKDVQIRAAWALGQTRDQRALPALRRGIDHSDPAMQRRCMASLTDVTGEKFGMNVQNWRDYLDGRIATPPREMSIADRILSGRWF